MRPYLFIVTFLGSLAAMGQEIKPIPTAQDVQAFREARAANRKVRQMPTPEDQVPVKLKAKSFMDTSDYFVGALGFTIIPKGSVISLGKNFQLSSTEPQGLPYMKWERFTRSHRAGLKLLPVQLQQIEDGSTLGAIEKEKEFSQKSDITCVTIYNMKPVRVAEKTTEEVAQN